jgi:phosphoglycolate phosphatase
MALRAVIFDFDFTLGDSAPGVIACITHALDRLGLPRASDRRIVESIGLSMPATLAYVAGVRDPAVVDEFTKHFVERADAIMLDHTVIYACAPPVIRALRAAGLAQGIVSSKFRYRIEATLAREGLAECFGAIVGGEDTALPKPDPAGLLLALRRLGCPPSEAVYVGDHPVDADAAACAGVPFVATLTGVSGRTTFVDRRPLAIIDDLSHLPAVLGV